MSRSRIRILSAALPLLVMVSLSPALAADPPAAAPAAPPDTTRFVLAPSITLSDVGLDTNILTTARDQKRDATGNIKLELEPSLPFGRARLSGKLAARGAWFRQYAEQRSLDSDDSMKLEVRLNRLTAHASGSYLHAHDRFDPEIFVRTLRTETAIEAGSDFNVSRRTNLGVALQQSSVAFEVTTVALDARLREALNRNTSSLATWMRSALTPLTTVAVIVDTEREHFDFMPERDATSVKAVGGLEFKPAALVDGKVFAGYRAFSSVGDDDSNGRGFAGSLDLGYTLASRVRIGVEAERDFAHSFRLASPYYVFTRLNNTVTARIESWEIRAVAGREWLDYGKGGAAAVLAIPEADQVLFDTGAALDKMFRYGGGATYRLRPGTSIGLDVNYFRFHTGETNRNYDRLQVVSSVGVRF
jgi:hypothetical protein